MAGSMREVRRGVWELRVYLGRDDAGRVRHRYVTFRGGKRAAAETRDRLAGQLQYGSEARRRALAEVDAGIKWNKQTTFNDAWERWRLDGWQDLGAETATRYRRLWEACVRRSIGTSLIARTGPYNIERFLRQLKTAGHSEATVRDIQVMLDRTCRLAQRRSTYRLPNPVKNTQLPKWNLIQRDA